MATPAYMSIVSATNGLLTDSAFTEESVGNTYQGDHPNEVMVQAFEHEVIIPTDPQSGTPTGDRIHKPARITKVFDRCSPLLLQALCDGEKLEKVVIKWYRQAKSGKEHYFTTTLEHAIIVKIHDYMHNCQDPNNQHFTHLQDVYMTYRKITWDHVRSTTTGSDDWDAPKQS